MSSTSSQRMNDEDDVDWKKDFIPLLAKYGLGTLLAVYFVWFTTTSMDTRLGRIETAMYAVQGESEKLKVSVDANKNSTDRLTNAQEKGNLILSQICVNGASLRERPNCFQ